MSITIGISACLLGHKVRYDGGHKQSRYVRDVLSEYFDFHPVCPEVGIGMATPRPAIRLITTSGNNTQGIEAVQADNHDINFTQQLQDYAKEQASKLTHICGYIFMQKSPSCGYSRVKLYHSNGNPLEVAQGIYAAQLDKELPLVPKEEAGRLNDPSLRDNFITRVMAYSDWRENVENNLSKKALSAFHVRYKYLLMAHHIPTYRSLGKLLGDFKSQPIDVIAHEYITEFMSGLKNIATRKKNTNVLQHLQGYLKKSLSTQEKQELSDLIHHYRKGTVPLISPITLLKHHIQRHTTEKDYLRQTLYINPHPFELGLRNAV